MLICMEKLLLVAPNWSSLCSCFNSLCIPLFQQITKMYDMLNKNSLGLLRKGAAKQSRFESIVKLWKEQELNLWVNRLVR